MHTVCRRGGNEYPVLFNIYMDFVLRCVKHNTGLKYSTLNLNHLPENSVISTTFNRLRMLVYADDIVLFREDIYELNNILNLYDSNFHIVALLLL